MAIRSFRVRRTIHLVVLLSLIYLVVRTGISWTLSAPNDVDLWGLQTEGSGSPDPPKNARKSSLPPPGAEKVMYGLKTGANILWNEISIHEATTFNRWPQHVAYAEIGETVGDEPVVDLFDRVPESVINDVSLEKYRILKQQILHHDEWDYDWIADYDGWSIDRFKNIPMAAHMWEHATPDTEWFIIADGDTYMMQAGILELLKNYDPHEPWLIGSPALSGGAITFEGEDAAIWFPHGGSGVITSRGALDRLFADGVRPIIEKYTERVIYHCCGDAMYAIALYEVANVSMFSLPGTESDYADPFQGHNFADTGIIDGTWCYPLLSFHHLSAREIQRLYEYETRVAGPVTQSQFYDDFLMPFVLDEREWWDAFDSARNDDFMYHFTPDAVLDNDELMDLVAEAGILPFESRGFCQMMCEYVDDCMVWRWKEGLCTVSRRGLIVRGRGVREGRKDWNNEMVWSGWMLSRIRSRRSEADCYGKTAKIDPGAGG